MPVNTGTKFQIVFNLEFPATVVGRDRGRDRDGRDWVATHRRPYGRQRSWPGRDRDGGHSRIFDWIFEIIWKYFLSFIKDDNRTV